MVQPAPKSRLSGSSYLDYHSLREYRVNSSSLQLKSVDDGPPLKLSSKFSKSLT